MDFNKKQKAVVAFRKFLIRAFTVFIIFIAVILLIADIKIYKQRKNLESSVLKYEKQIEELNNRNNKLEEEIANSDNPDYIEKVAREEQDMQKPGEKVVSFIMPKQDTQSEEKYDQNIWNSKWFAWIANIINWLK